MDPTRRHEDVRLVNVDARTAGDRARPEPGPLPAAGPPGPQPAGDPVTGSPTGTEPAAGTPAPSVPAIDRRAAFAAGPPKMSRRIVYVAVAVILVVGLGGSLVDKLAVSSAPPKRAPTAAPVVPSAPVPPQNAAQLHAPLPAFLGLKALDRRAPAWSLTDAATGAPVSLAHLRGHVVVLTFADAACNDICPVLATELTQADALLGSTAVPVTFVTVNTDPLATGTSPTAAIISHTSLGGLANWQFVTGGLHRLNRVWVHYGVSITADRATGVVAHDNVLYFIGPGGKIAWRATPFADESPDRTYSLSPAEKARFAQGIAHYADQLASSS